MRVPAGGQPKRDRTADRLADEDRIANGEEVEQRLDRVGEVAGGVVNVGSARLAVARQVERDHLYLAGVEPLDQRIEVLKLRPQRVDEDHGDSRSHPQITHIAAIHIRVCDV